MKCPKCGRVWADTVAFCPVDDAVLLASEGEVKPDEPGGVQPGIAATVASADDDIPTTFDTTPLAPPRMVEPRTPEDDADTIVRPKSTYVTAQDPEMRTRMNLPIPPPPPVTYAPAHPHPPASSSNPWKVAFLAMLGVLAIGGILFWLLRGNPNASNQNTAPLVADPNGSPMLTASPPTGAPETSAPLVATPPPYEGANANTAVTPTPLPPTNVNANVDVPRETPTPTPSPSPRNNNQNANTTVSPTPTPRTAPKATPSPTPMGRSTPPISGGPPG